MVVLGYSPKEKNFEEVVWGIPPDKPGRMVRGLKDLLEDPEAKTMIITGGTEKDGRKEAEWMRDLLYQKLEELKQFSDPVFQKFSTQEIREILDRNLILETNATNTRENLENVAKILKEKDVKSVVLVTSPDHISRAMRDAIIIWQETYPEFTRSLFGSPSTTLYSEGDMGDVVIAEPPVKKKFNLARIFGILKNEGALRELDELLKKYGA